MTDKKISEMTAMVSSEIANDDSIVIADTSQNHTKRANISELSAFFGISPEGQRDTVGQLFTTGTHSGVTVTYDDPNDKINIVLNGSVTDAELGHLNGVTSDIQTQIGTKSNIASPTFTGTVSAPTPSANDNSTKIATTSYVQGELTAYAGDTATFTNKSGANSQWTNDSGYITPTSTTTLTNKTGTISQWTNNSGYTTATSTDTLTNKSINGSNNTVTNIPYSALGMVDTDIASVSASHDSIPSALATKTYVDAQITGINELSEATDSDITSPSAGQILVHDGTDSFDNKTVSVALTGAVTGTGNMSASGAVSFATTIPNDTVTINGQSVALGGSATIPSVLNSGGTFIGEVHINDNVKLSLGGASGSGDLEIYHDGNHSRIVDTGTGNLKLQGNNFTISNADDSKTYASADDGGATKLHHNGDEKIATSSGGVYITGDIAVQGQVDGREVSTDGTKLDGIASGAEVNVQADYNATSGDAKILNKPSLATVATSGSYTDLSNKPSIPSAVTNNNVLTNGAGYITSFTNTTYSAGTGLSLSGTTFNNTITNNNQLTNGNGYITSFTNTTYSAGTGMSLSGTTFNCNIDSPSEVGLGNLSSSGNALSGAFTASGNVKGDGIIQLVGGSEIGRLTSSGNNFYIQSTVQDGDILIRGNDGGTTKTFLTFDSSNNGDATFNSGNVTISGSLQVNGAIVSSGNITAYSDKRLKSGIKTIDNALDKVEQMRGVTFYKDGELSSGVIAQEMEQVAPELVLDGKFKSVAYGNTVGYLIEAIKELKNEIEELKSKKNCECK